MGVGDLEEESHHKQVLFGALVRLARVLDLGASVAPQDPSAGERGALSARSAPLATRPAASDAERLLEGRVRAGRARSPDDGGTDARL